MPKDRQAVQRGLKHLFSRNLKESIRNKGKTRKERANMKQRDRELLKEAEIEKEREKEIGNHIQMELQRQRENEKKPLPVKEARLPKRRPIKHERVGVYRLSTRERHLSDLSDCH